MMLEEIPIPFEVVGDPLIDTLITALIMVGILGIGFVVVLYFFFWRKARIVEDLKEPEIDKAKK